MSTLASAAPADPAAPATALRPHEHLLVRVGPERFAVPLAAVAEALEAPAVRAVAGADRDGVGFLRWRGRQLAVRCARAAFGRVAARPPQVALVLADAACAVVVDELLDVVSLPPERVRPVRGLHDPLRAVAGVACDAAGMVVVLRGAAVAVAAGAA